MTSAEGAQTQDLGLQFGNFSSAGGDFGFGFDSSAGAAGWGVQQRQQQGQQSQQQRQQQQQPQQPQPETSKKQPSNPGMASKLPDAVNGSTTVEQQAAYPPYFGGMMPNAYGNYMMPPAVPMAGGYAGYEGYQQPAQNGEQNGAYADYYKQQAAAAPSQQAPAEKSQPAAKGSTANSASGQPMQVMPNAYGHPMYSYPYAMPHQPAYPYAVQSHYPYPPAAAGVYPGAAPNGKQAVNAPPGYKMQEGAVQRGAEQNGARRDNGQAAQYAEQQQMQYAGCYTQYASQQATQQYRQ